VSAATITGVESAAVAPAGTGPAGGDLTGTATLTRFVLRRDRVRIGVWIAAIVLLVLSTAASVKGLFPTQADLDEAAESIHGNAAAIVFNGPDQALDTMGGQVAFQIGAFGLVLMALMAVFMVGRETRAEEESGRLELVRAMPVGRHAPTAAAMIVAGGMSVVVGVLISLSVLSQGLPAEGCLVFGASFLATGLVFSAVALVAAQVTENTRVVYGLSGVVLGAAFVLRAAGDVGDGTLSWFSPIGWAQKSRPWAGDEWWPLLLPLAATASLVALAGFLATRRDVGGGLVQPRPGPATAAPGLGSPLGLARRLQRGSLIAWTAGLAVTGIAYGSVANDVEDLVGDSDSLKEIIARAGGSLVDSYLATSLLMLALIGSGFAISSVLRLRSEETALHAEPVLATPVSRTRWAASHLVMAVGGSAVVVGATGLCMGLTYGIAADDLGQTLRVFASSLAYLPAVWLLIGLALALFAFLPRATLAAWGVLAVCFIIGLLSDVLNLPSWADDLSPFEHVPQVPAADVEVLPLAVLTLAAAGLMAAGLAGFRRRDVG
jgi:ABC-2 type transport system permease protein